MSIQDDIIAAANKYGVDPATMLAIAQIESNFNPSAYNKSGASGVFQFMPGTASDYGLKDPFDAASNIDAGARLARDNTKALTKVLGRPPTAGELYLAHQQGLGGAKAILSHPELSAVDALSTIMSPARARASVVQNGGDPNMTAAQFAGLWTGKADKYAANYAGTPATALDAANGLAGAPAVNPLAYAPTPAGLPTMDRSGLIPPIPAPMPTMDRSGPPTVQPITLPNGSVVIPGKPYIGTDGSITTFDAQGNRTHVNPPLVNIGEEMGKNTIIGGLARKYGADFMDQGKAAVQSGLNTAGTAAMDLAASLPTRVADLGAGLGGLFGFGSAPKPPLLTPGANAAPSVPPKMPAPPKPVPASTPPAFDFSTFYKTTPAPAPVKPPVSSLPVSTVPERAPLVAAPMPPPVPSYSSGYGAGDYGYTPVTYGAPPLPAPAPLVPGPMMTPVAPPPLRPVTVPPVAPPRPISQPSDLDLLVGKLRAAGMTVTGDKRGYVDSTGSLRPTTTMAGKPISGPGMPADSYGSFTRKYDPAARGQRLWAGS